MVRGGLPKKVGVKQKSDGEKREGRVRKPRATANTEAPRQESLGALEQRFPNVSSDLARLVKHRWLSHTPRVSESVSLRWGLRILFLTSSLVMPMLLVGRPHTENHLLSRGLFMRSG